MKRTSLALVSIVSLAASVYSGCGSSSSGGDSGTPAAGTGGSTSAGGSGGSQSTGGSNGVGGAGGSKATGGSGGSAAGAGGGSAGKGGGTGGTSAGPGGAGGSSAGTGGTTGGSGGSSAGAGGETAGSGGTTGGSGGSDVGGSGGSAGGTAATPIFCPIADPFASNLPPNAKLIQDAVLMQDDHWTKDNVYLIGSHFEITQHKLTIDAGTVICLYQQGAISVGELDPGEIHFNGTPGEHITITTPVDPNDPTKPGVFHGGISLNQWNGSSLSYVDIWYGGPGGGSGAWAFSLPGTSGDGTNKGFLVDHLTMGMLQTRGLEIGTQDGIDPASNIHITGYAPVDPNGPNLMEAVNAEIRALTNLTPQNLIIDVANIPAISRWVHVETNITPGEIDRPVTLTDLGLPYRYFGGLRVADVSGGTTPTFTIHEGVTLQLDSVLETGYLPADVKGNLVFTGSAAKPIILTSNLPTPAAGDWNGIHFNDGLFEPAVSKLDFVQVLYAGNENGDYASRCGMQVHGAVVIDGSAMYDGPTITNTLIAHSPTNGIVSFANDSGAKLTNDYSMVSSITFMDIAMQNYVIGGCMLVPGGMARFP